ncbi:MAG: vanadium-dependent haloperoxidase [Gemmatimonadaceae bacterium]
MKTVTHRRAIYRLVSVAALSISIAAACSDSSTGPAFLAGPDFEDPARVAPAPGEPLASIVWNELAQSMSVKHRPTQQGAFRTFAYMSLAQHAAVEAAVAEKGATRATVRGAVAGASAPVLAYAYAADAANFEAAVRAEEATIAQDQRAAFQAGEALGRAVAAKVVARAQGDRFTTAWTGTVPAGPDKWFSSAAPPAPPLLPMLGQMQPFFMRSGDQFRPVTPPAAGSQAFVTDLQEVRRISDTRTFAQDSIAKFWALGTGTLVAGFWNTHAAKLIVNAGLGERAAAHTFALINAAGMDALISSAEAKFTYWLLRPSQADPQIKLAIGLPNFPAYPSNHAAVSGAVAYVLGTLIPAERVRLETMAEDAAVSRIYGGIHYRFDATAGLGIAREVTRLALNVDRRGGLLALAR